MAFTTYQTVMDRFGLSEEYANASLLLTEQYIQDLQDLLQSLKLPDTAELDNITLPEILPLDFSSLPTFAAVLDDFPLFNRDLPSRPLLADISDIDTSSIPERNFNFNSEALVKPTVNFGSAPTEPQVNTIDTPIKPDYELPTVPVLEDIEVPAMPEVDIPLFTAVEPALALPSVPANIAYTESVYTSEISVALFAKILYDIQNGGTGLDTTIEAEIYDRGQERQRVENESLYNKVLDHYSSTGFNFAPGILGAKLIEALEEGSRKTDQINREITINQAELAQKNTHFTIEQAGLLEKLLRDFFDQQAKRAFDYAKAIATIGLDIFGSEIERQKLKFEVYAISAEVFKTQMDAARLNIEMYRIQLDSIKITSEIQESRVRIYKIEVEAIDTIIRLYATEVESSKLQAQIEALKVDIFKAQTDAYVASITAEKAKIEVYSSEVEAEKTRAIAFGEEVKAYATEVSAKKTIVDAQVAEAGIILQQNTLKIDEFRALLEQYRAEIEKEVEVAKLSVDAFRTDAIAFDSQVKAKAIEYDAKTRETDVALKNSALLIEQAKASLESTVQSYVALKSLEEKGTEGIMNVNAQLAASSMNAVNASAGISASSAENATESNSESLAYQHTYNYDV